jgi:acylphosphatase
MKESYAITLTGRVQNVGFRYSAMRKAEEYDVKGFVQNKPDGTVYIEAEGTPEDLNKFMEWCKEGPVSANVENMNKQEIPVQNFKRFFIK